MRSKWLILVAMTGSLSMVMLDQTVVTVALPTMGAQLGLSVSGQQWVINAYVLATAALVAVGGKLGDRFGGVTVFRAGVLVFFLASALCGLTPTDGWGPAWLITARVLQGAGAALMLPVSAAIVINAFDVSERGRAMAVYAGISQVFLAIGPLIGGVLTQYASWRTVFWLNVPVGFAALVLVHLARPENGRQVNARISAGSVALLVGGIASLVLGLQQTAVWGWTAVATWWCIGLGAALTAIFVVRQLHSTRPLVAVRLFADRSFAGPVLVLGLVQFGLLPVILFNSLYLQDLLGFSPVRTGVAVLAFILPLTVAAQRGGRWYDRSGVRPPVIAGLAIALAGLVVWAVALPHIGYLVQIPGMILTGFGLGLVFSPANTDALGRVQAGQRGQASGLVQTVRQLGGTIGVAVLSAVVLGFEHAGSHATPAAAAQAIGYGYIAAAAIFALALIVAIKTLGRERIAEQAVDTVPEPAL